MGLSFYKSNPSGGQVNIPMVSNMETTVAL